MDKNKDMKFEEWNKELEKKIKELQRKAGDYRNIIFNLSYFHKIKIYKFFWWITLINCNCNTMLIVIKIKNFLQNLLMIYHLEKISIIFCDGWCIGIKCQLSIISFFCCQSPAIVYNYFPFHFILDLTVMPNYLYLNIYYLFTWTLLSIIMY